MHPKFIDQYEIISKFTKKEKKRLHINPLLERTNRTFFYY